MSIATAIALSGMNAASLRLQVLAGNAANSPWSNSTPQQITASGVGQGVTGTRPFSPALLPAYTPTGPNGDARAFATSPYTRLTDEMVQQLLARFDLTADERVVRVDQQMSTTVIDLLA